MPLDGLFLHALCDELNQAVGSRVEKIYQPSHDTFVFHMRGKAFHQKLLLTIGGAAPRVHFTQTSFENPATPSSLCMLVRKHFHAARLDAVEQLSLDRTLTLTFSNFNEMGDAVTLRIVAELMGRQSNLIFIAGDNIIDAVRRTDPEKAERLLLPGAVYQYPTVRDKQNLFTCDIGEVVKVINAEEGVLSQRLVDHLEGVSPFVAREIALRTTGQTDAKTPLTSPVLAQLRLQLERLRALAASPIAYTVGDREYSFMPVSQYGFDCAPQPSFSDLLDRFYQNRMLADTMKRKSHDLLKLITSLIERTVRKIEKQRGELARCADKEQLRIYGELLKANMYRVEKGAAVCEVENYYETPPMLVRIPLKPELSPAANAQRYFKEYKKAHTAEEMLSKRIAEGAKELDYFESVFDTLTRATSEKDLQQIRAELIEEGYLRVSKGARKLPKAQPPITVEYEGYTIYIGRNNKQNDLLTLKTAAKSDIWLHTKSEHGSHVIIDAKGQTVPDAVIAYAAGLAAYHSKARQSSQVAVDYCPVKHVKKPAGAKPGMVVYEGYNTLYVTPCSETKEL